ncbi:unnamed protein product, partial [Effrenium voratum]
PFQCSSSHALSVQQMTMLRQLAFALLAQVAWFVLVQATTTTMMTTTDDHDHDDDDNHTNTMTTTDDHDDHDGHDHGHSHETTPSGTAGASGIPLGLMSVAPVGLLLLN